MVTISEPAVRRLGLTELCGLDRTPEAERAGCRPTQIGGL